MSGDTTDRKFANTLARGLAVLRAFRASDSGLTHAQIADRTGLPKPTVSRLTYTLCELGYLSHGGPLSAGAISHRVWLCRIGGGELSGFGVRRHARAGR